ncbi:MAG: hypothetical protein KF756_08670 [Acidobacteria bacterium]|nr:hypothetical protein [Acidobacteriota bacterium]
MNRSVKIAVVIIGTLSIAAGVYSILNGRADGMTYFAFFIGAALLGTAFLTKPPKE